MEVTMTFLMITDCFWRKHRHDSHVSKIAWKPFKFNLYLLTQIKLSSLKKLQRSGRNGIWDVYAENDPENVIVKVLETHVFTLKNFRNYAGIILHPLWLKQYTRDYDSIIYLSLSVTVQQYQLRSFSLFLLLVTKSSRSWELLGSEDWKACLQMFPNILTYKSLSVLQFSPKTQYSCNVKWLIHWKWLGNTPSSRSLEFFLRLAYERVARSGCISSPLRITWHMSLGY